MVAKHSSFGRIILDQNEQVGIVTIVLRKWSFTNENRGLRYLYPDFCNNLRPFMFTTFKMELVLDFII